MPGGILPLHIFEERYRQMTHDILDSNGLIAMATFAQTPDEAEYTEGAPELRPSVCVGYSVEHERLEDGRYLIVLKGVCRAKLVVEVPHEPYRTFIVEPTEIPGENEPDLDSERKEIANLLAEPKIAELKGVDQLRALVGTEVPTSVLADITVAGLCENSEDRYHLLALADPVARSQWIIRYLKDLKERLGRNHEGDGGDDDLFRLN